MPEPTSRLEKVAETLIPARKRRRLSAETVVETIEEEEQAAPDRSSEFVQYIKTLPHGMLSMSRPECPVRVGAKVAPVELIEVAHKDTVIESEEGPLTVPAGSVILKNPTDKFPYANTEEQFRAKYTPTDPEAEFGTPGIYEVANPQPVYLFRMGKAFAVDTPWGVMEGQGGDYLVTDGDGHWVLSADAAKQTYRIGGSTVPRVGMWYDAPMYPPLHVDAGLDADPARETDRAVIEQMVQAALAYSEEEGWETYRCLARNPLLSEQQMQTLARDGDGYLAWELARRGDLSHETVNLLAARSEDVRRALRENPSLSEAQLERVNMDYASLAAARAPMATREPGKAFIMEVPADVDFMDAAHALRGPDGHYVLLTENVETEPRRGTGVTARASSADLFKVFSAPAPAEYKYLKGGVTPEVVLHPRIIIIGQDARCDMLDLVDAIALLPEGSAVVIHPEHPKVERLRSRIPTVVLQPSPAELEDIARAKSLESNVPAWVENYLEADTIQPGLVEDDEKRDSGTRGRPSR